MNSNTACPTSSCDTKIAELPRYYPRQLITPDDLTLEQNYFRDRLRRHNRLLHGWGVVCGALVCPVPNPVPANGSGQFVNWQVQIEPGYILGPYGDEIIIDCKRTVDLRTSGVTGVTGDTCVEPVDPWCSQVFTPPTTGTLYIAVKYRQYMTRPVRVQPSGCGCSDSSCEYSRWHDGYEIGVLTQCPPCPADQNPMGMGPDGPNLNLLAEGDIPGCPDCSCGPWVGLASVTVNTDGSIGSINNCDFRRLVLSFGRFWWGCHASNPTIDTVNPDQVQADGNDATLLVTGTNFRCGATVTLGAGIAVKKTVVQDSQNLKVTVNVPVGTAPQISAQLQLKNMDGGTASTTVAIVARTAGQTAAISKKPPPSGQRK
ncbi:MAG TPA: hypothetical protein VMI93_12205 [Candidatus Solibacter sp.]|nr:hypothetical protein [Candidatus Solibacter sp.]